MIKNYKTDLTTSMEELMEEMAEHQTFISFKGDVTKGLQDQEEFENLRAQEKSLNTEIKKINDDLKRQQDEFAKEAQESSDDIARFKKQVNETKTESELQIQYRKREIEGRLLKTQRLYSRVETDKRNQIKQLQEKLEIENIVSERIKQFITKKRAIIEDKATERDVLKEKKLNELQKQNEDVKQAKAEADKQIEEMHKRCEEEEEDRKQRELKDEENAAIEKAKIQEKMDMDAAALYIQRKWNWFQIEGRALAKKNKKKGKKGGKKKKK